MINDYINISSVESHLCEVLQNSVCEYVYADTLPSTLESGIDNYVVVDCGTNIRDLNAYGKGVVNVFLYAQPKAGVKNVPVLSVLESKFMKALHTDKFDTEHYSVARNLAYESTGYDTTYNMHYIIKAIHLIIK